MSSTVKSCSCAIPQGKEAALRHWNREGRRLARMKGKVPPEIFKSVFFYLWKKIHATRQKQNEDTGWQKFEERKRPHLPRKRRSQIPLLLRKP